MNQLVKGFVVPHAHTLVPLRLGFINPVYVFSVGYGLAVAAQGAGLWALASASGVWIPALCAAHLAGAIFYGVRLGGFLYWRSVTWKVGGGKRYSYHMLTLVFMTCSHYIHSATDSL
jgi:hypothetical protein